MFQTLWSTIAPISPSVGATKRTQRLAERLAIPKPMPVIAVNSGCANGDSSPRRTKMTIAPSSPSSYAPRP